MASNATDKSKPDFPLAGGANDGYSKDEATTTCFCGAVQLAFVYKYDLWICHLGPDRSLADPRSRPDQFFHLQLLQLS